MLPGMTSRNVWSNKKWTVLESWNTRRLCTDLFTVGLGPGRWLMKHPYPAAANNPSWLHSLDGGQMILNPHFCWSNMVESCYFSKTCFLLALLALLMLCVCVRVCVDSSDIFAASIPNFSASIHHNHHFAWWKPCEITICSIEIHFFLLVKSPFVVLAATSWGVVARSRASSQVLWASVGHFPPHETFWEP